MVLSPEEMFYLATGILDMNSWRRCSSFVLKPLFINVLTSRNCAVKTVEKSVNGPEDFFAKHQVMLASAAQQNLDHTFQNPNKFKRRFPQRNNIESSTYRSSNNRLDVPGFCDLRSWFQYSLQTTLLMFIILFVFSLPTAEGCSSRSTPKPRPPPPSPSPMPSVRPNITFQTYACPPAYATYFCLNGATCFTIKIGESILYNCECTEGYMGQRCEYKDLDGSYLPLREKIMLERASIAGGATMAIVLVVIISIIFYTYAHQRKKEQSLSFVQVTVGKFERKPHFMATCHFGGSCECHKKNKRYPPFYDEHYPLTQDVSDGVGISKLIEVDVRYSYATDSPVRQSFHLRNINQQLFNQKQDNEEIRRQDEERVDMLHQKGNC